jgi:hypothetical protein
MNNNGRVNLNGVFGFNKLLVGNVDVEPNVVDNTLDIKYIYDNVLSSLQNQITATVSNALNASEIITTINDSLTNFQTTLSTQETKQASDITLVSGQITTEFDTLDSKYDALVTSLTTKQTNLENQITTLSSTQQNLFSPSNSNTFSAPQTFANGLTVQTGGTISLLRNTTIGSTSANTLTINASPEFKSGLVVSSGTVSFPSNSISASSISNLPAGISLSVQNTWSALQAFNSGISSNGITTVGAFNHYGSATLGDSTSHSLTIKASPTFNAFASFTRGLTVTAGSVIFPNNSISSNCISGLLSLGNNNTWTGAQTFSGGIVVNGTTNYSTNTVIGSNSTNTLTVNATPDFKSGLSVSSGTVSVPNNAISMSAVNGLNTKVTALESDISSIKTKQTSDKSELQLQINALPTNTSLTSQLANYCLLSSYNTLKTQADGLSTLLTNTQYISGFGLNWYGSMNVFGSMIVTVNNNYFNVGSLLSGLPTTYVSNTSLTNTLNSYATKTYVDGKVSLSSNQIGTLTSTQIGYRISTTTSLKAPSDHFNGAHKLAELEGLAPIGSVWIVEAGVQQGVNAGFATYYIEVQEGGTYTAASGNINASIITIHHPYLTGQSIVRQRNTINSASAVYVVSSTNTSGKLCLGGSFVGTTTIQGLYLRATRIA